MEIINQQKFISWELPKNWTVLLSENPDKGDMNVSSLDAAQKSRFLTWDIKYDNNIWCQWAEIAGIDGRCINFMIKNGNEVITEKNLNINARILTKFFNSIKYVKDFNNIEDLNYIQLQAEGAVDESFAATFISFIRDGLDKLITPERMLLHTDTKQVLRELRDSIWEGSVEKVHVSSILAMRFGNYCIKYANGEEKLSNEHFDRIYDIYMEKDLFRDDLRYALISKLFNGNKTKFERLITKYPALRENIMGV
jgi:hypothetical protein